MKQERYAKILNEFETFLRVGTEVSNRLVGTTNAESHLGYADSIFTKLLCHAISLHRLSPQVNLKTDHELWDLPSACALARCLIEAYDVLGYMVFSNISPEEREFRILLWRLHDQQRRSKMLRAIDSKDPKADEIHSQAQALQKEAIRHSWYTRVRKDLKKKIESGDAPAFLLSQRDLNVSNCVNHVYHTSATMWLSQYVHTFPMSVHQLFEFKAGTPEALHMSAMPIQFTLGFLAKAILGMVSVFPKGNMDLATKESELFSAWTTVVEKGVTTPS